MKKYCLPMLLVSLFALTFAPSCVASKERERVSPEKQYMEHKGQTRSYIVHIPRSVEVEAKKVPLVIVMHGGGGDAESAARMTGFSRKAQTEGFIVVYPDGSGRREKGKLKTWNVKHCCGFAMKSNADDVGYIGALIDKLIKEYPVDPKRVFATGMSNGGMMAHRVGYELSDKVAGIAPVVSGLFGDEVKPQTPVPAVIINGLLDESFPMRGGQTGGRAARSWDGTPLEPVKYQGEFWAKANGCKDEPARERQDSAVVTWTYSCPKGKDVVHYIVKDNGHAWPSGKKGSSLGDEPSKAMNATDVIWAFFSQL